MTTLKLVALLLLAVLTPARAATRHVRAGQLVDTERGRVLADQLVTIVDGRVTSIGPWRGAPVGGALTDWSRYMVLPGLIDTHTHLADWGQTSNVAEPLLHSAADVALMGAANARTTLEAGFTSVHDVGCYRAFTDLALRDAIRAGRVPGPRMKVVGAYLTVPGGGGEVTGLAPDVAVPAEMRAGVVTGAAEARQKTQALLQRGADSIKLIATGAVLTEGTEPGQLELTEEEMSAAVREAAAHGSWATAHAHGAEGIKAAIRAGVRSVEHASLIDDEGIALARARGVVLVMDIYNGDYIEEVGRAKGWPEGHLRKNRETTDAQREAFRKCVRAGVKIAFGTDAGVFPHGTNARQFAYMVRFGMTPMQAIQSATVVAAALPGEVGGDGELEQLEREVGVGARAHGDLEPVRAGAPEDHARVLLQARALVADHRAGEAQVDGVAVAVGDLLAVDPERIAVGERRGRHQHALDPRHLREQPLQLAHRLDSGPVARESQDRSSRCTGARSRAPVHAGVYRSRDAGVGDAVPASGLRGWHAAC